jgi:hypothetical protein
MGKPVIFTKQKDKSKEKDKEKDKELLSKKRQEPDSPRNDVDMLKIKKKVNEIMTSICNPINNIENDNIDYLYKSMYKNYLLNEFTSNCLNYVNKIITDVKSNHLKKFQGIFELNKLFISIIKELLMNEFELLLLSLYLESIDISLYSDVFTFKESLIYLCYFIKKLTLTLEKLSPINSFLIRKYQSFEEKFNKWFQSYSSIINAKLYFSYMEINQRYKEYNSSYSIYCKNNYIDYNLIIDRILTMSIPYNESKNDNLFTDKKDNSLDNNNIHLNSKSVKDFSDNQNIINGLFYSNNNYNKSNYSNNNLNNLYNQSYITGYTPTIFIHPNHNNPDINIGYLYNGNNIIYNGINNNNKTEQINPPFINKENILLKQNESKCKSNLNFKVSTMNNINNLSNNSNSIGSNDNRKIPYNTKHLFITEEIKKKDDLEEDNKTSSINDNNNNIIIKNQKNIIKKEKNKDLLTPNNLLYSLDNENINILPKNIQSDNNILVEKMCEQIKSYKNNNDIKINNSNNNNIINSNKGVNINQNNLISFNTSQHINDCGALKCNSNLGVNDFNPPSQMSLLTASKNNYFADINNIYQNSFRGIEQDDNFKQLINQSNDNFFKSCLSMGSSNNYYPIISNINYSSNNIGESGNMNNINYQPINQMIIGNTALLNINNGLNINTNLGKSNINQDKKDYDDNNIKNNKNDEY